MQLPVRLVLVDRKRDKHAVAVFDHEIPVLEAMYGQGAVQVSDAEYDTSEVDASAGSEFARLQQKYRSKNDNPVLRAYPGGANDLSRHGFKFGDGGVRAEAPQSVVKDHRKESKAKAKQ